MILDQIYEQFHNSRNIKEKKEITKIVDKIEKLGYKSNQIYASLGEDAAAIELSPSSQELILITTDAILPEFIASNPFAAGFSAIYVGIDDIMACGGTPIACSSILTYKNRNLGEKMLKGIIEATNRFQIPLIRGHTTTDSSHISLSSTVIGTCKKEGFLSAKGLKIHDSLGIIWDKEGLPGKTNPHYWNTITNKDTETFYKKRSFIKPSISNHLFHTCKDISNGGILGTLYQLLQVNQKGAVIFLDQIKKQLKHSEFEYPLSKFLFLFLTSAFLISFEASNQNKITKFVSDADMEFYMLGTIVDSPEIVLQYEGKEKSLIQYKNQSG